MSWRLHDEPAAKPSVIQTGFERGMDVVNGDDGSLDDRLVDDEPLASHERQSLLRQSNADMRILRNGRDGAGSATCARTPDVTEAEEIWGELEDDADAFVQPSALPLTSPVSTFDSGDFDGNGGFRDSASIPRAKRANIRVKRRSLSMLSPRLRGPESSDRSKLKSQRSQDPPVGWWRWRWWRRRSKDEAL